MGRGSNKMSWTGSESIQAPISCDLMMVLNRTTVRSYVKIVGRSDRAGVPVPKKDVGRSKALADQMLYPRSASPCASRYMRVKATLLIDKSREQVLP
jgi:hypothetical protein